MIGRLMKSSLKVKVLVMVFGICVTLGAGALIMFERSINSIEEDRLRTAQSLSGMISNAIAAQFFERYGDVQAFALNDAMQGGDVAKIENALNSYIRLYGIYDSIVMVDLNGEFVAASSVNPDGSALANEPLKSKDYSGEVWFQNVKDGKFTEDSAKGFAGTYVSEFGVDPLTSALKGIKVYGNSFSAPVKDAKGQVIAVLSARAGARWVDVAMLEGYRQASGLGLAQTELAMLNKEGLIVTEYHPFVTGADKGVIHDLDAVNMKLNLATAGVEAAKRAVAGKSGVMWSTHARKKIVQAVGYGAITSPKFIDSIGWSVLVRFPRSELAKEMAAARMTIYLMFFVLIAAALVFGGWFSGRLARTLNGNTDRLDKEGADVASSATQIAATSTELSESVTEQAAALQETVSAVDEISAMVSRNAETARRSADMSRSSVETATRGRTTVEQMITAISEVSTSNNDISTAMEQSNREISEIVKVISEIGEKTKVINDIVFQTKLLSFNASVEAARAGEHGKGFAVVAEEVGNLAQMSGSAAKEISAMLDSSIEKVERIVEGTKVKVASLVETGREKVQGSTKVARQCGEALTDIQKNVEQVSQLVAEIASASQEQAQGIQEVTKAMSQLDQVTQQNAAVATQASSAAENLNAQAAALKGVVLELRTLVRGGESGGAVSGAPEKGEKKLGKQAPEVEVSNVVSMTPKKAPPAVAAAPAQQGKRVVGSDVAVPDSNDPRFKDV